MLQKRKLFSSRDVDLQVNQIQARDEFGDRVFDLEPRVHLEEIKVLVLIHQEFNCARIGVRGRLRYAHRNFSHAATHVAVHDWRRRLFQNFLVPALNGRGS